MLFLGHQCPPFMFVLKAYKRRIMAVASSCPVPTFTRALLGSFAYSVKWLSQRRGWEFTTGRCAAQLTYLPQGGMCNGEMMSRRTWRAHATDVIPFRIAAFRVRDLEIKQSWILTDKVIFPLHHHSALRRDSSTPIPYWPWTDSVARSRKTD